MDSHNRSQLHVYLKQTSKTKNTLFIKLEGLLYSSSHRHKIKQL